MRSPTESHFQLRRGGGAGDLLRLIGPGAPHTALQSPAEPYDVTVRQIAAQLHYGEGGREGEGC